MEEPTCPATPPLCKCPDTPPRAGSSKSSPSRWDSSKEKSPDRPTSPQNCAICLGPLADKSCTDKCFHQFCYVCLLEWSKVKAECPLCKVAFGSIYHNIRSLDDYDIDKVVREPPRPTMMRNIGNHPHFMALLGRFIPGANGDFSSSYTFNVIPNGPPTFMTRGSNPNGTSAFRRSIYQRDLWARLQPDITGRYRDCSPEFYTQNPAQLHRLIPFLNRELNVLLDSGGRTAYVMEKILELLPMHSIQSTMFRSQVARLIGHQHAPHFCHELRAFASSPFDMVGYDRAVQYHPNGGAGVSLEVEDLEESDAAASGADDDDDVLIIENELPAQARRGAHASTSASTSSSSASLFESSHSHFPQRISSSIAHTSVVNVSSDSESDVAEDIQVVGFVKPRHERTPEIITLSSPEHPDRSTPPSTSTARASGSSVNSTESPICIHLGNNTSAELKWHHGNLDDVSSDDASPSNNPWSYPERSRKSVKKNSSRRRHSSESSSSSGSEEEKERERRKRHAKHRKSKRGDKNKSQKHSKSRKRKRATRSSNEEDDSQPSTSKGGSKRPDKSDSDLTSPRSAQSSKPSTSQSRNSDFSESDQSSQKSVIRSAIVRQAYSNRYSSADEEDTFSQASNPKVSNLLMTRTTTGEGLSSWIVAGNNSSSDSQRNKSDRHEHRRSSHHSNSKRKKSSHSDKKRRARSKSPKERKKVKAISYSDDSES